MDPVGANATTKNCPGGGGARTLVLAYGRSLTTRAASGRTDVAGHYTNARDVVALTMVGDSAFRRFRLMLRGAPLCTNLRYGRAVDDANPSGPATDDPAKGLTSRPVLVRRVAPTPAEASAGISKAWVAESRPDALGRHVAWCEQGTDLYGDAFDVPFRVRVVQKP
jgi:hypothetical protein